MEVIATKQGFDGVAMREKGDQFEMPDEATGSWFKPADDRKKKAFDKAVADKATADAAEIAAQQALDAAKASSGT
jgi:hypothetical protein